MTDTIAGTFELGPTSGQVRIKTGRAGAAAKAGHDLTLAITKWSATATVPDDGDLAAASISAELDLGSLEILEATGGLKPLSDKDRRDILTSAGKTLGAGAVATFASTKVIPSGDGGAIEGTLTLNGKSQPLRLQVVSSAPGKYSGSGTVVQTAHGIKPFSAMMGALKLKDEVTAEFEISLG